MEPRQIVVLIARRAGFGLTGPEVDAATAGGVGAFVDRLVDPAGNGVADPGDPWGDDSEWPIERPVDREQLGRAVDAWLTHLVATPRPLHDWMVWAWHGHLVSGLDKVRQPLLMIHQLRLLRDLGWGRFDALVRAVTIDAAMLVYLDGNGSSREAPNENYSRELLELFTLGIGNYTEDDVQAGARALTGWRIDVGSGEVQFRARRHDDTPQRYLGRDGVHDLDTVVGAVTGHDACAPFVTRSLGALVLGTDAPGRTFDAVAAAFGSSGLDLTVLVRSVLEAAGRGEVGATPVVLGPVPWLVNAQRVTGAVLDARARLGMLRAAGQVPMAPPNVAGWPGGAAWLAAATVVARENLAAAVAQNTPDGPALAAARDGDPDGLAYALGLDGAFGDATVAGLRAVGDARARLAVALVSPEFVLA